MRLTVLSVSYPLAAVGQDAVGGSEQVLWAIDAALVAAGHRSLVIAPAGSRVAGELIATPAPAEPITDDGRRRAERTFAAAIRSALARERIDVVHYHGLDFPAYRAPFDGATVATLHLPPDHYPAEVLRHKPRSTVLVCVSEAERRACPAGARIDAVIPNGVDTEALRNRYRKRGYVAALGRICREKGFHLALDAAHEVALPLLLAGQVHPYAEHQEYHRREITPRLDRRRRFLGPLGFRAKRRLMGAADCVVVPSLVPETASLVAMEALACGAPVAALRRGALPDVIDHGVTGWLVDDPAELGWAMLEARRLDPERCRAAAARRFPVAIMTGRYLALYAELARRSAPDAAA